MKARHTIHTLTFEMESVQTIRHRMAEARIKQELKDVDRSVELVGHAVDALAFLFPVTYAVIADDSAPEHVRQFAQWFAAAREFKSTSALFDAFTLVATADLLSAWYAAFDHTRSTLTGDFLDPTTTSDVNG